MHLSKTSFLRLVLVVVLANYFVQIPYYLQQYFLPHGFLPSLYGSILLGLTLMWFLVGYVRSHKSLSGGYGLLLSFFVVEFLFYLQTQVSQLLISHRLFLHVYRPDNALLFIVFAIGYLNFMAAAYFIPYLVIHRRKFLARKSLT